MCSLESRLKPWLVIRSIEITSKGPVLFKSVIFLTRVELLPTRQLLCVSATSTNIGPDQDRTTFMNGAFPSPRSPVEANIMCRSVRRARFSPNGRSSIYLVIPPVNEQNQSRAYGIPHMASSRENPSITADRRALCLELAINDQVITKHYSSPRRAVFVRFTIC